MQGDALGTVHPAPCDPATGLSAGDFDTLEGAMFLGVGVRRYLQVANFDDTIDDEGNVRLDLEGSLLISQIWHRLPPTGVALVEPGCRTFDRRSQWRDLCRASAPFRRSR